MAIGSSETINIEVSSNIKSVIRDTDRLAISMKKVQKETQELGKGTKAGAKGFTGVSAAVRKLGYAIKAIGIGMLIAAFVELKNIFGKNQEEADATSEAYETFKIILEKIVTAISNLIEYISDSSNNFSKLTGVVLNFVTLGLWPLKTAYQSTELAIRSIGNVILQFFGLFSKKNNRRMKENMKVMEELIDALEDGGKKAWKAVKDIQKNTRGAIDELVNFAKTAGDELSTINMKQARIQARAIVRAEKVARAAKADSEIKIAALEQQIQTQQKLAANENLSFEKRTAALKKMQSLQRQIEKEEKVAADVKLSIATKLHNKYKKNVDMIIAMKKAQSERDLLDAKHLQNKVERAEKTKQLDEEIAELRFQLSLEGKSEQKKEELELERAYEKKKELAIANNIALTGIEEQYQMDKAAIEDRYREEKEGKDKDGTDKEISLKEFAAEQTQALFDAINANMDARASEIERNYNNEVKLAKGNTKALAKIEKKFEDERKELAGKQKKLQVGMATISMLQSVIAAFNSGSQLPGPAGIIGGPVAAAIALAAGLANIRQILAVDVGSGGGGSVGATASPEPPAPEMMSGAFELEGGKPVEPMQAYVVSDDITDSQDKLAIIRRRATI